MHHTPTLLSPMSSPATMFMPFSIINCFDTLLRVLLCFFMARHLSFLSFMEDFGITRLLESSGEARFWGV
jgi:hypothetical protein